jgi:predicted nucleotidyltransferase
MDKLAVIEKLRRHEAELKAAGVVHLRLFGSVARGEQTEASDVDLMADFDPRQRRTLVSLARIQNMLSDLLGAQVDLSVSSTLREPVKNRAQREAILAF